MSDSWMAWKPRTEEPSKFSPSSKTAWSKEETGTVKCCMIPGRSQNLTSTISTPSSEMNFSNSSLFANIRPPRPRRWRPAKVVRANLAVRLITAPARNLGRSSFLTVSGLFRPCNGVREPVQPAAWIACRGATAARRDRVLGPPHHRPGRRLGRLHPGRGGRARTCGLDREPGLQLLHVAGLHARVGGADRGGRRILRQAGHAA